MVVDVFQKIHLSKQHYVLRERLTMCFALTNVNFQYLPFWLHISLASLRPSVVEKRLHY